MNNYFIILAGGKGRRFAQKKPKQYFSYKGKLLIEHSIDKALQSKLFKKIIVVSSKKLKKLQAKYNKNQIKFLLGGKERKDSSLKAMKIIKKLKPTNVLIHDAARPNFSIKLLRNLIKQLKYHVAVIPSINSNDSVKYKVKNKYLNLNRKYVNLTQTPQAFVFKNLYNLAIKQKEDITDEA